MSSATRNSNNETIWYLFWSCSQGCCYSDTKCPLWGLVEEVSCHSWVISTYFLFSTNYAYVKRFFPYQETHRKFLTHWQNSAKSYGYHIATFSFPRFSFLYVIDFLQLCSVQLQIIFGKRKNLNKMVYKNWSSWLFCWESGAQTLLSTLSSL